MIKKMKNGNISITKIILITFISLMLVSGLIIGRVITKSWFAYVDKDLTDSQFTSIIRMNMVYTVLLTLIAMIVTIIVYILLTRKLLKPLDYLLDTTEKFAKGDISQRVLIVRDDEIGRVSRSFNNMADTICDLVDELEDIVKERTQELKLILDSTEEAIYGMNTEGACTFCNASGLEVLGYSHQDELIGKNMHYQVHHTDKDGKPMPIEECRILRAIKEGRCFHADDEIFWRKDGTSFEVEYRVHPQLKDGEIVGAVVTFIDITESKKAQKKIEYLSSHDSVTGLYNRMFFENKLKRIDKNENLPISIIYIDVNGLKLLNDIHGHEKGDELLKRTAEVLTKSCREDDIIARVGGDEFAILLANTESKDANKIIERIKVELASEPIAGIKCSISVASDTKTTPEQEIKTVIRNAETEMYKAKTLERKKVSASMLTDIMESLYKKSPREKLHSINVAGICEGIAINMNLPETHVRKAKDAGFYHDIGKIALDEYILNKEGELKDEEKEEMKRHPLIGYRILNLFDSTLDIGEAVLTHHERWDGSGYPKGLKGDEIPMFARIISVAEGYDAMTNKVGGKGASPEDAVEEIKSKSGIKYDPKVVEAFLKYIKIEL